MATIVVTISGASDAIKCAAASFTGMAQTAPLGNVNTVSGSTANPSNTFSTANANSLIVGGVNRYGATAITANSPFTSLYAVAANSTAINMDYYAAGAAGSYTDTFTVAAGNWWALPAAEFKSVGTVGFDTVSHGVHNGYIGSTTVSWAHTCTGTNLLLVVFVGIWQDVAGTGTVSGITYNGIALSKATSGAGSNLAGELWYLPNPNAVSGTPSNLFFNMFK